VKLKITANFDFGQLSNKLDKVIEDYSSGYAKEAEVGTKRNIDTSSKVGGGALKLSNKSRRSGQQPLYDTGKMYKSIKSNGSSLNILKYGAKHHFKLYPHLYSGTETDDFIGADKKTKEKLNKQFMKNVRKNLRKTKG